MRYMINVNMDQLKISENVPIDEFTAAIVWLIYSLEDLGEKTNQSYQLHC